MLADWRDDGRIDRAYAPSCYQEAIETLPLDLRDYSNAAEVIERALLSSGRAPGRSAAGEEAVPSVEERRGALPPLPEALLALGLLVLAGAAAAALALRRRATGRRGSSG